MSDGVRNGPNDAVLGTCRRILREHDVSTALLFGSAGDPERSKWRDLDLLVEFATDRPGDDGYSATYLGLLIDLDDALDADVDVVDSARQSDFETSWHTPLVQSSTTTSSTTRSRTR